MIPEKDPTASGAMNPWMNRTRSVHSLKDRRNGVEEKARQDVVLVHLHRVDPEVVDPEPEHRAQDNRRVAVDQEPEEGPEVDSSKSLTK